MHTLCMGYRNTHAYKNRNVTPKGKGVGNQRMTMITKLKVKWDNEVKTGKIDEVGIRICL